MILRNNDTDKHVAEADIVAYKLVYKFSNNEYKSAFKGYVYKKDKVNDGSIGVRTVTTKGRIKVRIAEEGFHSYKHLKDAKSVTETGLVIVKCIIPKGSTFYNGFREYILADGTIHALIDQYVSDKIIVKEEIKI